LSNFRPYVFHLYWLKFIGCSREFGLIEALRRVRKEFLRGKSKSPHVDMSWVTDQLAIGAAPRDTESLIRLRNMMITDIIDLRAERKENDVLASIKDLTIHWIPIYDDWLPKNSDFFEILSRQADSVCRNSEKKLAICCGAGEHRAALGGVVALWSMGYSLGEALELIKKSRPVAEFLSVYLKPLRDYLKSKEQAAGSERWVQDK
jgi:hypothetical protein